MFWSGSTIFLRVHFINMSVPVPNNKALKYETNTGVHVLSSDRLGRSQSVCRHLAWMSSTVDELGECDISTPGGKQRPAA